MKRKIEEFINTEKRLSSYKISLLKTKSKEYAKRIIKKEQQFLDFDFNKVSFKDIDDCRDGIYLFKVSRHDFLLKYLKNEVKDDIPKIISSLLNYKIEINNNKIDGFYFKSLSNKNFYKEDGKLKKIIIKRILFLKIMLYYSAFFIKKEGVLDINNIVNNFYYYIYFNDWIDNYIDFFSKEEKSYLIDLTDKYKNLFDDKKYKKLDLIRKTKDTDLLITRLPHQGYEKTNILYLELNKKTNESIVV